MEEDKRINYHTPLLSVRRLYSSISSESKARGESRALPNPPPPAPNVDVAGAQRSPVDSDAVPPHLPTSLGSGPVRRPGVVPFQWEQSPGCPKETPPASDAACDDPRPSCGAAASDAREHAGDPEVGSAADADDAFSDALETLSRADSCLMNCSVGGMTGGSCLSRKEDPQARDMMMNRFLPAAQAVATGSPHTPPAAAWRATPSPLPPAESRSKPLQLQQNRPQLSRHHPPQPQYLSSSSSESEDDGDHQPDDRSVAGQLAMKGCGFLPWFCLKGSSGLTDPVRSVTRVVSQRKRSSSTAKPSLRSAAKSGNVQTLEAARRHKLGGGNQMQLEDDGRLTSESNRLTPCSTDSLSPDVSSSYRRRSTDGATSSPTYRKSTPRSPRGRSPLSFPKENDIALESNDSVESGSRASNKYFEILPHLVCKGGPGSESSNYVTTGSQLDSDLLASPRSISSFAEARQPSDTGDECFEAVPADGKLTVEPCVDRIDMSSVEHQYGTRIDDAMQPVDLLSQGKDNCNPYLRHLLPPPLPKSPSESWLLRTLPTFSSKNQAPAPPGTKFLSSKKDVWITSAGSKWKTSTPNTTTHNNNIRFSEVRASPIKEDG